MFCLVSYTWNMFIVQSTHLLYLWFPFHWWPGPHRLCSRCLKCSVQIKCDENLMFSNRYEKLTGFFWSAWQWYALCTCKPFCWQLMLVKPRRRWNEDNKTRGCAWCRVMCSNIGESCRLCSAFNCKARFSLIAVDSSCTVGSYPACTNVSCCRNTHVNVCILVLLVFSRIPHPEPNPTGPAWFCKAPDSGQVRAWLFSVQLIGKLFFSLFVSCFK